MERMCEDCPPVRRVVEGKEEGEALAWRWDWGVVKAEKDVTAERGVPSKSERGVLRVDIPGTS
jgi:hypothetical protein